MRSSGGIEDVVERDREFDGAETGGEVPAAGRDGFDQKGAQFRRQRLEPAGWELAQIGGRVNAVEQGITAVRFHGAQFT
jgi:hypothetical protein